MSKYIYACLLVIMPFIVAYPQIPTHSPKPDQTAVDFSQPINIVLFIILPLILVVLYLVWRKKNRKNDSNE